jgi:predicted Zn-dependent protease with MMP-like domain/Flp pilus assembly protein TadD
MGRRALINLALAGVLACGKRAEPPASASAAVDGGGPAAFAVLPPTAKKAQSPASQPAACPVADKQDLDGSLDEAAKRFEKGEHELALACAEQAARISPRSVEAHHDRAEALAALERFDEAKIAYTMALALDPDDPETLASAADFYINRLGADARLVSIGLEYARRGSAHVGRRREDKDLAARLSLLEAEALDDMGRADDALTHADTALQKAAPGGQINKEARYQHALIQFHLCRLDKARKELEAYLATYPDDAFAHHHYGLILEREGTKEKEKEAELHFAKARQAAPSAFPPPYVVSVEEFKAMVDEAVAALEPGQRRLLDHVKIELVDVPALTDLLAVTPPFPPTILGLYRGTPLGEEEKPSDPRAIVLYRKNLGRAVTTLEELKKQVKITLLHEMGHLTGADEDELRARGLE